MTDLDSWEQYFSGKAAEANYNLWNALLTVNGIMVSGFSLLLGLGHRANDSWVKALIAACCISILLLLWNYLIIKRHYIDQGQRLTEAEDLSDDEREKGLAISASRHKWQHRRESAALILLFVEVGLVALVVFSMGAASA